MHFDSYTRSLNTRKNIALDKGKFIISFNISMKKYFNDIFFELTEN